MLPTLGFYPKILGFFEAVGIFLGFFFSGIRPWDFSNQRVIEKKATFSREMVVN